MTTKTVRVSYDAFAGSDHAAREHGSDEYLRVKTGQQQAFLWARLAPPRRATVSVQSQVLRLFARGASAGVRELTVQRVSSDWTASKLNWNNKPVVVGASATVAIGDLSEGDVVDIDITAIGQAMVSGAANHGYRLVTDAGTTHKFYGADAGEMRPRVITTWTRVPEAPEIRPAGGTISLDKPTFVYEYDGDGDLTAVQLQIDAAGDEVTPDFDSGEVVTSEAELDTTTTAFAGITDATTTQQRGRVKVGGVWSQWSDWESLTRAAKGTLTVDNPSLGVVTEPTPPLLASFAGEDLTAYRVQITTADRTRVLWDTEKTKATDVDDIAVTPPHKVKGRRLIRDTATGYSVRFRAWGDPDRVNAPGDPAYVDAWADFVLDDVGTVAAPTALAAAANGDLPGIVLTWTIAPDAPDSIVVLRDGKVIESGIEPEDALVAGTAYAWTDISAPPHKSATYTVRKVVNGEMSPASASAAATSTPGGVWIVDQARDLRFGLTGTDVDNWRFTDQSATFDPAGSPYLVRILTGMRGMSGEVRLELRDRDGLTREQMLEDLWAIKERPTRTVQLIAADWSFPVKLDELSPGPHPGAHEDDLRKVVGFSFRQVDDLPFDARL